MLTMWRITAIVLAVLVAGIAYSTEDPNLKTTEPKDTAKPEQRGSDNNPFTVKVLPTPDAEAKAAQEEKYRNDKSIQDEKLVDATVLLARVTIVLAGFTALLWWATYSLAKEAKRTATQQAVDMQASLATAKQSADAAKSMAATMDDTAERQLRAYAMVKRAQLVNNHPTPSSFGAPWIYLSIKNFGRIPATAIECRYAVCVKELELSSPLDGERSKQRNGALAPGDTWTVQFEGPLRTGPLADRHNALYVHGEVRYFDGFHPDKVTRFRYMRKGGNDWSRDGEMETCPEGNEIA
jgi:hypothetical protein